MIKLIFHGQHPRQAYQGSVQCFQGGDRCRDPLNGLRHEAEEDPHQFHHAQLGEYKHVCFLLAGLSGQQGFTGDPGAAAFGGQ